MKQACSLKTNKWIKSIITTIFISVLISCNTQAQSQIKECDSVKVIKEFRNFYQYGNFYLAGQPTLEQFQWLKNHGVKKIINLRSEKEIKDFTDFSFDEKSNAEKMGFEYHSIPIDGIKDYSPENLDLLANLLNNDGKVLIHCTGAGRVTDFFMAWLVKAKGYSIDEAVEVGKKLKFSIPLEKLLDKEFTLKPLE